MRDWKYCPKCGSALARSGSGREIRAVCARCGYVKYDNPLPTTIGLVVRGDRVLLLRRGIEPEFGKWDTVGGFMSGDETAEEGLRREAREEIGLEVDGLSFVGSFSSVYGDTGLRTIGLAFRCSIADDQVIELSGENTEYRWFDLGELPDVAFADVRKALAQLQSARSSG
ncbi:NUDIX domain-containing protein [Nocardia sp. NPDC006044]|uniref:NUDIX domain-containing protein n=1 Tax=Nocardia sp. NPDC006044 TaxID=3364306 RepID=UPI0036AACC53